MKVEEAKILLQSAKIGVVSEVRLSNNSGTKIKLENGAIVNVFDSGNFNVQGKNQEPVKAALGSPGIVSTVAPNTKGG